MPIEFDTNDFDPDKVGGSFDAVADGLYHVQVDALQEEGGRGGEMIVDFGVLAGTTANQEGKSHREYFSRSAKAAGRALQLACAVGLTTIEELKKLKEAGKNPVIDFTLAVGRQLCIGIESEEYQGKTRGKVDFRIWSVDSPKAANIPKAKSALDKANDTTSPFEDPRIGGDGGVATAEDDPFA